MFNDFKKISYRDAVNKSRHQAALGYTDEDLEHLSNLTALNRPQDSRGAGNLASRMAIIPNPRDPYGTPPIKVSVYDISRGGDAGVPFHPDRTTEPLLFSKLQNEYPEIFSPDLTDPLGAFDNDGMRNVPSSADILDPFRVKMRQVNAQTKLYSELNPCEIASYDPIGCRAFLQQTLRFRPQGSVFNPDNNDVVYYSLPSGNKDNTPLNEDHLSALEEIMRNGTAPSINAQDVIKRWRPVVRESRAYKQEQRAREHQALRAFLPPTPFPERFDEENERAINRDFGHGVMSGEDDHKDDEDEFEDHEIHRSPSRSPSFHSDVDQARAWSPGISHASRSPSRSRTPSPPLPSSPFNIPPRDPRDPRNPMDVEFLAKGGRVTRRAKSNRNTGHMENLFNKLNANIMAGYLSHLR